MANEVVPTLPGTGVSAPDIANYYIQNEQWKNVLATWKEMADDLGSYCGYYASFIETDTSKAECLWVAKQLSTSDSWRLQINTGYYQNDVQIVGTAKGYFPTLNHWRYQLTGTGLYDVSRSDSYLVIGSSRFEAAGFKDKTVPYYLGVIVQGAGGGGGGTWGSDDGTGGGGGGCLAGVLKLEGATTIQFYVGAGGAGGYKKEVNSSIEGGAKSGEPTNIYVNDALVCSAGGGGAGRNSTKSNSYAGGAGGTVTYNSNWLYCVSTASGGRGGKVYGLSNATGMAAQTAKVTALSGKISDATHKDYEATRGGAQGDNNAPGGGGGGREYNGPAGGGYTSDGKAGEPGCGGSGARYTFATYKRGGKGGNGYITLFY